MVVVLASPIHSNQPSTHLPTCWELSLPVTIWTKSASETLRVQSTLLSLSPSRRTGVAPYLY